MNLDQAAARDWLVPSTSHQAERAADSQGTATTQTLTGFLENVGALVATRATLHRVAQRLAKVDLVETVTGLLKRSNGNWKHVRTELRSSLESWTNDLSTLSHAETEMGAALDQFRETALALSARPAAEMLHPLQRLVQGVAQHLGKVVDLQVTGADVGLDSGALDVLADPVRRLVWFAVAHGIERPVERWEVGKPTSGCVSVVVRKTADRVRVVIEDDGQGIDHNAVLERARELGWASNEHIPAKKLSEWVLQDGFGIVGGSYDMDGIDLAAINTKLGACRGRFDVNTKPGQGTRFALDIPLDTVVIDGMVMRVDGVHYVVPIEAVRRIVKPEEGQIIRSSADGGQDMLRLEDGLTPIQTLAGNGHDGAMSVRRQRAAMLKGLLVVVETGDQAIALMVDELVGQQQVLIQPLQGRLAEVQAISGCVLLGEGDVGMVLDLGRLLLE